MSSFGSELVSELYRDMQDYCHGLVSLVAETRSEEEWDDVIKIVMANLGLQRLRFARKHHEPKDGYQQLMMAIKGLSQLRQLTLYSLTEATALQILEACPSLKHLTVSKLTFSHTPTLLHQEKPALRLSYFKAEEGCELEALLALLNRCPSLRVLVFGFVADFQLGAHRLQGRLEQLKALSLANSINGTCESIVRCIPSQQLCYFAHRSFLTNGLSYVLENHFDALEVLVITVEGILTMEMTCLFTKCHRLRELYVTARDNLDVRRVIASPWAFRSTIEQLEFPFSVVRRCENETLKQQAAVEKAQEGSDLQEWLQAERVFMKRLSECTRLRFFDSACKMGGWTALNMGTESSSPSLLSWRLLTDLDHLNELDV